MNHTIKVHHIHAGLQKSHITALLIITSRIMLWPLLLLALIVSGFGTDCLINYIKQ